MSLSALSHCSESIKTWVEGGKSEIISLNRPGCPPLLFQLIRAYLHSRSLTNCHSTWSYIDCKLSDLAPTKPFGLTGPDSSEVSLGSEELELLWFSSYSRPCKQHIGLRQIVEALCTNLAPNRSSKTQETFAHSFRSVSSSSALRCFNYTKQNEVSMSEGNDSILRVKVLLWHDGDIFTLLRLLRGDAIHRLLLANSPFRKRSRKQIAV